jgi:hypothetical protein
MSGLTARMDRLIVRQPTLIRESILIVDLSKLNPRQRCEYDRLNERFMEVGAMGMTVDEMYACADLVELITSQQPL